MHLWTENWHYISTVFFLSGNITETLHFHFICNRLKKRSHLCLWIFLRKKVKVDKWNFKQQSFSTADITTCKLTRLEIDSIHCPWQGVSVAMHKESETEGPKWNAAANLTYTSTLVTCFMKHAFVETYYRFLPTTGWDRSKKTSWFWGDEVGNVM